ncbi:MAG: PEP-CTERM sorting domain-containing protein [Nitrospirales bacterium]
MKGRMCMKANRSAVVASAFQFHNMIGRQVQVFIVGFVFLSFSVNVQAATFGFTDSATFQAALPSPASVVNFDNVNAGTPVQDGAPFQGISFASNVDNTLGRSGLIVSAEFLTTSPLNYLGVDDGFSNEFLFGDELTLNFSTSVQAVGLSIIAGPQSSQANDFLLAGGGGSVFNIGTPEQTLFDGGEVFFLGLISDQAFNTAQLISFGGQLDTSLGFNIDDITTVSPANPAAVPEPASVVLFGTGLLLFGGMKHWGRMKRTSVIEAE